MHSSGYEIEQDEGSRYPSSKTQGEATKDIARDVKVSQKKSQADHQRKHGDRPGVCLERKSWAPYLPTGSSLKSIPRTASIVDQLVDKYWWLCPMKEQTRDHVSTVVGTANSKIT